MRANNKSDRIMYILIVAALFLLVSSLTPREEMPKAGWGTPVIEEAYVDLTDKRIDQIVSYADTVYILFSSHEGFVQAYDSAGNYLYTMRFNDSAINGAFSIAAQNGLLYVEDPNGNVYSMFGKKMDAYYTGAEADELRHSIDFESSSPHYKVRLASVWYESDSTSYCFLQRPLYCVIYQYYLLFFSPFILAFVINMKRLKSGKKS